MRLSGGGWLLVEVMSFRTWLNESGDKGFKYMFLIYLLLAVICIHK